MNTEKKKCVIALDMGGTFIKYGLVAEDYHVFGDGYIPANSHDAREELLNRLSQAIVLAKNIALEQGYQFVGVAVSTPGPFDYALGVSHMVGKYDEIYDVDLRAEFRNRAGLPNDMPIEFMQDAAAFLAGEYIAGSVKGCANCMCVTLGTGTGYACILNHELLLNERKGPYYVLALQKHRRTGKLIEEIVSGTAIKKNYGLEAKTIVEQAREGDAISKQILFEIGNVLGEALTEIDEIKNVESIVIGGQISKGFEFLEEGILNGLGLYRDRIRLVQAEQPVNAALIGAATTLCKFD